MRLALSAMAARLLVLGPAGADDIARTLTADGTCERLVISGKDLTDQCGTALVQLQFDNGSVAVSAGTGGQAWFGLGEPEHMLLFFGPANGKAWSDHPVDRIVAESENPAAIPAQGGCTYAQAQPGLLVTCNATDDAGSVYALTYRTDGLPGFTF